MGIAMWFIVLLWLYGLLRYLDNHKRKAAVTLHVDVPRSVRLVLMVWKIYVYLHLSSLATHLLDGNDAVVQPSTSLDRSFSR